MTKENLTFKTRELKKVVDTEGVSKLDRKETIRSIRSTDLGKNYSCEELHKKNDVGLINIAKECDAEVIAMNPKKKKEKLKHKISLSN